MKTVRLGMLIVLLALASSAALEAQVVGQGAPGSDPWPVTMSAAGDRVVGPIAIDESPADQTVELSTDGLSTVGIHTDSVSSTPVFWVEVTQDEVLWYVANIHDAGNAGSTFPDLHLGMSDLLASGSANYDWVASVAGWKKIRVRYRSGTGVLNVTLRGSAAASSPVSTVNQGDGSLTTASSVLRPWRFQLVGTSLTPAADVQGGNLFVASAVANAASPTWSEGVQVNDSVDLAGNLRSRLQSWFGSTAPTVGQKLMASSLPIVFASDQSALTVTGPLTDVQLRASPVSVTFTNATIAISGTVDLGDRAGRLLGVVYGSQGQQLKQTAVNFNLAAELHVGASAIDPRSIRVLTSSDVVTANQGTPNTRANRWFMQHTDGTNDMPSMDADARRGFQEISRWLGSTAPTVGQKTMAASLPFVLASDQPAIPVSGTVSTKTALTGNAPATCSVGVSSASCVASNVSRKGLILANLSTGTICFGIGATAVLNSGVCLQPGAVWNMNEYSFATGAINAIASGAASTLSVQEFQ